MRARSDTIRADEYELHQAFVNLLLNALEAMGKGGTLSVSTEAKQADAKQDQLEIRIGDTGEGILPEHMDHVFEPFFTTKASGTGLGLAVTQRIIQEHGGSISVRSQPGRGTTFAVTLPLAVDEPAAQPGGAALAISGKKRE
jgi:signal transduction histidine kinase